MSAEERQPPEPRWDPPAPYGYPAAIDSMGTIAAPFLAGVSIALVALLVPTDGASGWETTAVLLLLAAAFAFVAALQLTFRAKQFAVTPPEIEAWWGDADDAARRELLRWEQRRYRQEHDRWASSARWAYDLGLIALLFGAAALLVPPGGLSEARGGRLVVLFVAAAGILAEGAWIANTRFRPPLTEADWPPRPDPDPSSSRPLAGTSDGAVVPGERRSWRSAARASARP